VWYNLITGVKSAKIEILEERTMDIKAKISEIVDKLSGAASALKKLF
jgi:hypothetical protein